jgi:drug/metabolite transporter (DMT)-like permease
VTDFFSGFHLGGVWIAVIAHGLIGLSLVWDKILLRQPETKDVVNYVFWLGAMSVFGLILIPFGFKKPSLFVALVGFGAGVVHLIANYYYYITLDVGEASQTLAIMGGFSPLFTYLIGIPLLRQPLGDESVVGFALMVGGGFFMFLSERINVRRILPLALLSAATFGIASVAQKLAFNRANFVTAYVFFTAGTFVCALFFLVRKTWREQIFKHSEEASPRSKTLYFINRFISGVASFLIFLAVSRTSPAIVDAISGLRYVLIFLGVYFVTQYKPDWLNEVFRGWTMMAKVIATGLVVAGLVLVGLHGKSGAQAPAWLAHPIGSPLPSPELFR